MAGPEIIRPRPGGTRLFGETELSRQPPSDAPALVRLDGAGWHDWTGMAAGSPSTILRYHGGQTWITEGARTWRIGLDPWRALRRLMADRRGAIGAAAGWFGYELGRELEGLSGRAAGGQDAPDLCFGFFEHWAPAGDGTSGAPALGPAAASIRHSKNWRDGSNPRHVAPFGLDRDGAPDRGPYAPVCEQRMEHYLSAVSRIQSYIAAGDIYQANYARRWRAPLVEPPLALYGRLCQATPAPYAAYLSFGDTAVLTASPELFLSFNPTSRLVCTRPIKGTRPRGVDAHEDRRLARELQDSEKDRAENLMIVDVHRNDLGKTCVPGTVRCPSLFDLEAHPTVFHLVSTVTGVLDPRWDALDLVRACLPAGSITGAPKRRAMEVIDELEPQRRGVYCGAIGILGFDGSLTLNVAIRTMVACRGEVTFSAGGGIVADSDPAAEWQESQDKARALVIALDGASSPARSDGGHTPGRGSATLPGGLPVGAAAAPQAADAGDAG